MHRVIRLLLCLTVLSGSAVGSDLKVLTPPVVDNAGLKELAIAFTRETNIKVEIDVAEMLKIPDLVNTRATDVFFLAPDLLAPFARDENALVGKPIPLGRVNIGLAVLAGAPHPDISTVPKLAAALRNATVGVVYSNPDPARGSMVAKMIDAMLKRTEFNGVHGVISSQGNGVSGLMRGEGDMALQLKSEILPHREVEFVAALPEELKEYIDISAAVSAKSENRQGAAAFIAFLRSPEALALWKSRGLDPK